MKRNNKTGLLILKGIAMDYKRDKYPNVPDEWLPKTKYKDTTANGLTKCIIDFSRFKGWQAERISNTGRVLDTRQSYIDVLGHSRTIGSQEWIKGTGTAGTADISSTIAGKSVKIEVKIKNDRQSEAQKKYQATIEISGGLYFIAKDFEGFYQWYLKTFAL